MRLKHLLGVVAVLVLILAVWLVPMALADDGAMGNAGPLYQTGSQAPSGSECPYLQAHPWLDPHGTDGGGSGGDGGVTQEIMYY